MQDCIDGITPLIFSEIDENTIEIDGKPFFIRFGETFNEVEEKVKKIGLEFFEIVEVKTGDDSAIDALIDLIDDNDSYDEDDENF